MPGSRGVDSIQAGGEKRIRAGKRWAWFAGLFIVGLGVLVCPLIQEERQDASNAVDVARLGRQGENWKIIDQRGNPQEGSLSLHHSKWPMYFLHWRPLGEERREVSLEDARKLLLSFWGPNMPFTLTGNEGQLIVSGHPACFVEGTIYNGTVRTIFIVWNCPQTGRQFIADTNINQARDTPTAFLDLQRQIALTTCCHGQTISVDNPLLIQEVQSDKFNLSFRIPPDWRTREFPSPKWFPTGMTPTNGTLWTLLTTSEKHIELAWYRSDQALTRELMEFSLNKLRQNPIQLEGLTLNIKEIRLEEVRLEGGRLIGNGAYKYAAQVGGKEFEIPYIFRAFLWTDGPRTHFLLASMAALKEMWQIPNDLTPSPEVIDRFVREEVLPAVAVWK
jgi:hypothetical protein